MLQLTDIRTPLPMRTSQGEIYITNVIDAIENTYNDTWDFDVYLESKGKNLQRDLVWSLYQKQQLIISVLKGIKIPGLCVVQKKEVDAKGRTFLVIDGKQRFSTLLSFARGEFPIEFNGAQYYIGDFDADARRTILYYDIVGTVAYHYSYDPITDDTLIAWFERINFSGTPQDEEHMKNLKA